jgi:hypothetical protein
MIHGKTIELGEDRGLAEWQGMNPFEGQLAKRDMGRRHSR